jgi:hypothetical protein
MVGRGGKGGDGFGLDFIEHRAEIAEDDLGREIVALGVLGSERRVRIKDADDFDVFAGLCGAQKSGDMAVRQAGDGEAQRLRLLRREAGGE